MLSTCCHNQLKWRYVLADSWFAPAENMKHIHEGMKEYFILALKSNRYVALNLADKKRGRYVRIDTLARSEEPVVGWVKGLEFPVVFHQQHFTNKDGSTGILYLISNDLSTTALTLETIYQKRWKVEVFHKTSNRIPAWPNHPLKRSEHRATIFSCRCMRALN